MTLSILLTVANTELPMRKLATIRTVSEITSIPNADRIQLATVDGWKCVIKAGEFAVGDLAVYCEIDSFLPVRPEFEFLRKSSFKKMGNEEGFRLKTVKLRGQISQGLLLSVDILQRPVEVGDDVTVELGIIKYEPPIPACLTGEVVGGFPSNISKTDEERIQNMATEYDRFRDNEFFVTEKLDGTSMTAFFDESFGVCGRNWQYADSEQNSYWRVCHKLNLQNVLASLGRRIAIQGELLGPGIQGNRYRLKEQQWFVFNAFDIDQRSYLEKSELLALCEDLNLATVPFVQISRLPSTIEEILVLAEGKSVLCDEVEREGLVWVHGSGTERISFKTISNRFLEKE